MENNFGLFFKEKRQEKNLTQKQIANILFVTESAVSKWEKGVAHPDITLLPKLSEILGVSEHELITASLDNKSREEKSMAKKWKILSLSWNWFFYIAYGIAILTCFICNLSINKTLDWFWIVVSALLLAFSFTNLPKLIKNHKLLLIPLSNYLCFCILIAVCAIYTNGNWFFIPATAVLLGLAIIFMPIYISKYKVFSKIRKYNDFVSIAIDFLMLNILLIAVDFYAFSNNFTQNHWYLSIAVPITIVAYLILNLFLCVRFLRTNKLIKTSIILFIINILYILCPLIKFDNLAVQNEFELLNILKANFLNWSNEIAIERNVHLIIFLTILTVALIFMIFGVVKHLKKKKLIKKTLYK